MLSVYRSASLLVCLAAWTRVRESATAYVGWPSVRDSGWSRHGGLNQLAIDYGTYHLAPSKGKTLGPFKLDELRSG